MLLQPPPPRRLKEHQRRERGWEGCMSWRMGRMLWNAAFGKQCALCTHESRAGSCIRPAWNKPYKRDNDSWDKELMVIDAFWEKESPFSSRAWLLVDCPCSGGWPHNHAVLYLVGFGGWGGGERDAEAEEGNTWSMTKGSGEGSWTWIWWRDTAEPVQNYQRINKNRK